MAETVKSDHYKITIERVVTTEYPSQSDILVEERHYTDKEMDESHRWMRDESTRLTKKVYGIKDIIAAKEKEIKIFEMTIPVSEVNLKAVINEINKGMPNDSKS